MKNLLSIILSISTLLFTIISFGQTQTPSAAMITLLQKLSEAGYSRVHEVEYKRGVYQVEAYNAHCQKINLRVNATTLAISPAKKMEYLTTLQVAKRVSAAGYKNIYHIEFDDGQYEVKSYNEHGYKIKLYVDPITGKINKAWS
jgi:hypothetical protein